MLQRGRGAERKEQRDRGTLEADAKRQGHLLRRGNHAFLRWPHQFVYRFSIVLSGPISSCQLLQSLGEGCCLRCVGRPSWPTDCRVRVYVCAAHTHTDTHTHTHPRTTYRRWVLSLLASAQSERERKRQRERERENTFSVQVMFFRSAKTLVENERCVYIERTHSI